MADKWGGNDIVSINRHDGFEPVRFTGKNDGGNTITVKQDIERKQEPEQPTGQSERRSEKAMDNHKIWKTSTHTQSIKVESDGWIIYHSLKGNPLRVNDDTMAILDLFVFGRSVTQIAEEYEIKGFTLETINILIANQFLVKEGQDERKEHLMGLTPDLDAVIKGERIQVLDLSVSERCNFACSYCIHSRALTIDDSRWGKNGLMTQDLAERAIDKFLAHLRNIGSEFWNLHFGSAEALINFELVRWVMDYLDQIGARPNDISINTNMSLMTPDIAAYCRDRQFRINTSIDGVPEVNDTVRMYRSGRGTAADILRGLEAIRSVGYHVNGIGITLCDVNFASVGDEIVDWVDRQQIPNVLFDIDSVNWVDLDIAEAAEKFVHFEKLCRQRNIRVDGCWKTAYENIRDSGLSGSRGFCASLLGNNILVAPSGKLYYCTYSSFPIGSINEFPECLKQGPYLEVMTHSYQGDFPECRDCSIEGHCLGGCLLTREGDNQQRKVGQMCQFYRLATTKLLLLDAQEEGR